jgi:hypothetical protein
MTVNDPKDSGAVSKTMILFAAAMVSLVLKMLLAAQGNNFDIDSFRVVADLFLQGKTIYAETSRYNYGPIWACILGAIRFIQIHLFASDGLGLFHVLVAGFLAYVDVLIGLILAYNFSFAAGLVFLLNPVSLLITGYHAQFDNLAILLALCGSLLLFKNRANTIGRVPTLAGTLLLGMSLAIKHILIFFPLWLFFRQEFDWKKRFIITALPYVVFLAMFMPFISDAAAFQGISDNVFSYSASAFDFPGFYQHLIAFFVPLSLFERLFSWVPFFSGFKFLWLVTMVAVGFFLRRTDSRQLILFYLLAMCVFSPQIADQYMAIPIAACAVFWRSWFARGYMILATLYLVFFSPDNISCIPAIERIAHSFRSLNIERWYPFVLLFVLLIVAAIKSCRKVGKVYVKDETCATP